MYLYEYTSGQNYAYRTTNQLIANLKKKPSQAGQAHYGCKNGAIARCSADIRTGLNPAWPANATLVPIPGSKIVGNPDYDDRMERACHGLGPEVDVRCLITQRQSTHANLGAVGGPRVSVDDLLAIYQFNNSLAVPAPQQIAIVDDVLTAGTHFRAMKTFLSTQYPDIPIIGIFVARRVFANPVEAFDDLADIF